ncbi:MAG: sulfur carrier protein ThiS [Candidatus Eremiobacteraeota bacterium]|nr:sulfur carrier protein ThiS [Candidatus Eremiobacteraeota bacterium]
MRATINGRLREFPNELTVAELLEILGSARAGVAVARNEQVVVRAEYGRQRVCEGDRVEIIEAVAGG